MLDMFAYVPGDSSLVIGAGIPWDWLVGSRDGAGVFSLPTPFGLLGYDMMAEGETVRLKLQAGLRVPAGGVRVSPPAPPNGPWRNVTVNGAPAHLEPDGSTIVRKIPADIRFTR
jgi:hypothetical protein